MHDAAITLTIIAAIAGQVATAHLTIKAVTGGRISTGIAAALCGLSALIAAQAAGGMQWAEQLAQVTQ